jgi:hypothetical protein
MSEEDDRDIESEERAIYWIITVALSPVLIGMVAEGGQFDGGATLSLILVASCVTGLLAGLRAFTRGRLPRARVHRRTR